MTLIYLFTLITLISCRTYKRPHRKYLLHSTTFYTLLIKNSTEQSPFLPPTCNNPLVTTITQTKQLSSFSLTFPNPTTHKKRSQRSCNHTTSLPPRHTSHQGDSIPRYVSSGSRVLFRPGEHRSARARLPSPISRRSIAELF